MKNRTPALEELINCSFENFTQQVNTLESIFDELKYGSHQFSETLRLLNMYLCDRARGAITLVDADLGWDAEIILRSYYECFCKIIYLCQSSDVQEQNLVKEFWVDMEHISIQRTSRKAKFAKDVFPSDRCAERDVSESLESRKFSEPNHTIAKNDRKKLEQKWSFTHIIESLDSNPDKNLRIKGAKSLLHIYGMASHLIHADASALKLQIDRASRPSDEGTALSDGHHARILSDIASLGFFALKITQSRLNAPADQVRTLYENYKDVIQKSSLIQKIFNESQKSFYTDFLDRG